MENQPTKITKLKTIKKRFSFTSLFFLSDNRLASYCDTTIPIYSPSNNFTCDLIIKGHNTKVTSLCQLENTSLVSASSDAIKVWEIKSNGYECLFSFTHGYTNKSIIQLVALSSLRISACSYDSRIRIFNGNAQCDPFPGSLITAESNSMVRFPSRYSA